MRDKVIFLSQEFRKCRSGIEIPFRDRKEINCNGFYGGCVCSIDFSVFRGVYRISRGVYRIARSVYRIARSVYRISRSVYRISLAGQGKLSQLIYFTSLITG